MKCRSIEIEIVAQGIERLALLEEKSHGTDIAVIRTGLDQRGAALIPGMQVAARGEKVKDEIGAALSDAVEHDCHLIVRNGKTSLTLAELEFVGPHIHPPPAEVHAFGLQTKPLLDLRIPAQFDLAAGAENPVPGQAERTPQHPCHLPCPSRQSRGARHGAISRNFSPRDFPDGSTNP